MLLRQRKRKGEPELKEEIGEGIAPAPIQRYVQFGSLILNKPYIYKLNKLQVKYPNGTYVKNFPGLFVSDDFCKLIRHILEEGCVNYQLINNLQPQEKELFSNLISKAKLESRLGMDNFYTEEIQKELKRYELLKGQVFAGNTNRELLQELKLLTMKFMSTGVISKGDGGQILFELASLNV